MAEFISKTDVVNMMFVLLGDFEIDDISDNTDLNAKRANKWYEPTVREVTRMFSNWNRCEKFFALTNDGVAPIVSTFTHKVNIPPDVIAVMEVTDASGHHIDHKVKGTKIYSKASSIWLRAQVYIDDPNTWDALMLTAVATRLAWRLCMPVTGDKARKKELKADFDEIFEEATNVDSREGTFDEITGQTEEFDLLMGAE